MFKRMATSVKTAIQNNKQQQQQQQLDDAQIPNDRTVSLIRDRNKAEKEFDRKNQRSKIVNENRLNKNAFSSSSTNVASSTQTTHGTMKKASSDLNLSKCNYSMSDQGTDRRKLLEQWRKNRQLTKTSSIKDTQRPVFKVQHLTSRFFDSKSMVDLSSIRNSSVLDSTSRTGYKFHDSIKHNNDHPPKQLSRQNSRSNLNENERYHFGASGTSSHKFVPQFTFAINLNALDTHSKEVSQHKASSSSIHSKASSATAPKATLKTQRSSSKLLETKPAKPEPRTRKATLDNMPPVSYTAYHKAGADQKNITKKENKTTESNVPITRSKLAEQTKSHETHKSTTKTTLKETSSKLETNKANPIKKDNPNVITHRNLRSTKNSTVKSCTEIKSIKEPETCQSTPLVTTDHYDAPLASNKPTEVHSSEPVNELLFEAADSKITCTPKSTKKEICSKIFDQVNRNCVLESTPKNGSNQKEELAHEFKKMNLSVKKAIKHFEKMSNSISNSIHDSFSKTDENGLSVKYFRDLVITKTNQLLALSSEWSATCSENSEIIPDRIQGDIRCACGLSKLLIEERFKQFSELIEQCEMTTQNNLDPDIKEVKCSDLQGFWEMINHQVKDVDSQFKKLEKIKQNNYSEEFDTTDHVIRVKKNAVRKTAKKSSNDSSANTVKSKFSEFRAQMKKAKDVSNENEIPIELPQCTEKPAEDLVPHKVPTPEADSRPLQIMKEKAQKSKKRSVIRSRPSDLIKFDSPVPLKRNNYNQAIAEHSEEETKDDMNTDLDKENDPFDFEPFKPIVWSKSNNKNQSPSVCNMTPKTPTRSEKLTQFNDLVNSPLLKLAIVSSHGKTRSGKKIYN